MEIKVAMDALMSILKTSFTIMGVTISFYELLIYLLVVGLICLLIGGLLR